MSAGQPLVAPAACALLAKHYGNSAVPGLATTELHHAAAACLAALTMRGKTSRKALASDAGACLLMLECFMFYGSSISGNIAISRKVIPEDWNDEAKSSARMAASAAAEAAAAACAISGSLLAALCNLSQLDESRSCLGYMKRSQRCLPPVNSVFRYLSDAHVALILKIIMEAKMSATLRAQLPVIERGMECALETLGNLARDREGRKCITKNTSWQTTLASALTNIQDAIMDTSAASAAAASADAEMNTIPSDSAVDSLRHAIVLLCRL